MSTLDRYNERYEALLKSGDPLWFTNFAFELPPRDVTIGVDGSSFRLEPSEGGLSVAGGYVLGEKGLHVVWLPGHIEGTLNHVYVVSSTPPIFDGLPVLTSTRIIARSDGEWLVRARDLGWGSDGRSIYNRLFPEKGQTNMPWLTIIMMVLSFFASGGAKKENRGKAALIAAGVGAATYYTTHETQWGQENLGQWDGVEIDTDAEGNSNVSTGPTRDPAPIKPGSVADSGAGGFWNTLGGWLKSPAGQVTTGVAGASILGLPKWLVWGGAALGLYTLLKD